MKRKWMAAAVCVALVALFSVGGATPAFARWTIHNSNDVTQITPPPGGTEQQTCADRLTGETGWATNVSPGDPPPNLPSYAFGPVNYDVWKPPPGFTSMNQGQAVFADDAITVIGYNFFDTNGNGPFPATKVKTFTTASRTALATPELVTGGFYVFTTAPINESLTSGVSIPVAPGDVLGLKPSGSGSTFINLTVITCPYAFKGFYQPVDNPPTVNTTKAGQAIPVKFSLTGDQGLSIFAAGYPVSEKISCMTGAPLDTIEQTVTAGNSSLSYDATTDTYSYVWKTSKLWSGTCRQLIVRTADGVDHVANFQLR